MKSSDSNLPPEHVIFGYSSAMRSVQQKVQTVAGTDIPVLVRGESGTGKEVVARLIHRRSPWGDGPFVKVNCPAIPATALEHQLFSYGQVVRRDARNTAPPGAGLTNRGTLFLDEIGELAPGLQAYLAQFLRGGGPRQAAAGGTTLVGRIICSTKRELELDIRAGAFRQDLFYRISVVNIYLPPLRARMEDIPQLIEYFVAYYGQQYNSQARPLPARFVPLLQEHDWPGNIRELENLIKRYVILGSEETILSELASGGGSHCDPDSSGYAFTSYQKLTDEALGRLNGQAVVRSWWANRAGRKRVAYALNASWLAAPQKVRGKGVLPKRPQPAHPAPVTVPGIEPKESEDGT